jgi:DNA-directed RNA polymerase II subunit RPB9
MDIQFCSECDNLLFLYEDGETNKLYYGCKACGNIKDNSETCIYNNDFKIDISKTISQNKYLKEDITLPSIKDNINIKCPNEECGNEGESKILYVKYDTNSMKYLYICNHCNHKWTNN